MGDEVREDDILLAILREQGCNIPSDVTAIKDFDAGVFFHTASVCLSVYHHSRNDGQPRYPTKLPGGKAQQFRVGTSMADDVKTMGYTQEVGYESFLYPSEGSMKKLLRFLVDKLPKPESEGPVGDESEGTSGRGGLLDVKKVLKEWTSKEWNRLASIGSDAKVQFPLRTTTLSLPTTTPSPPNKDALKYFHEFQPLVSVQARSFASFIPSILSSHSLELVRKENLVDEFDRKQRNADSLARIKGLVKGAFTSAIRSHEAYLSSTRGQDLSLFSSSSGTGRSAFGRKNFFENDAASNATGAATPSSNIATTTDGQSAEEREAAIKAEREKQLAELQSQLDELLQSQRDIDQRTELMNTQTRQLENELSKLLLTSRELEDAYLVKKRTLDLLPDAANNLLELQKLVASSSTRLVELGQEWEIHRIPLVNKLRRAKQLFHERKEEIGKKIEVIKRIREEMKEKANDLREKEKLSKVLTDELNALPKSINRQIYVKRIMDLMKNIDKQNAGIKAVLKDVKQVQKDINLTSESSKRSFAVADEVVFQSAKKNPKDDVMTKTYKYVVTLREGFVELVSGVEQKGKIENEIMSLQTQIDDIESRNTNLNMERIQSDLAQVKAENKQLAQAIKAASK